MKKTKVMSAKRSFFMSVLSLILCFAMLLGTTWAWFTDEVTSGTNRIVAGNLKVDLVMDKDENGNYVSIAGGQGDIFKEADKAQNSNATLWEPGKTQIVYLGVQNKGNLALKYNIVLNVVNNGLVGALEYAIIDGAKAENLSNATKWSDITSATGVQKGDIDAGQFTAAEGGVLDEIANGTGDETDYFALAVHMKEDAGNEYKGKDITIDVTVLATQMTAESDSFDNQYDKDAIILIDNENGTYTDPKTGSTVIKEGNEKVEVKEIEETPGLYVPKNAGEGSVEKQYAGTTEAVQAAITNIQNETATEERTDYNVVLINEEYNNVDLTFSRQQQGNNKNITISSPTRTTIKKSGGAAITINSNSSYYDGEIVIENIDFELSNGAYAVTFGNQGGSNATRYANNVTVKNCTATTTDGTNTQLVYSPSASGTKDITIEGCTVNGIGYLANGVLEGLIVKGCTVKSSAGINNSSTGTTVIDSTFECAKYCVRVDHAPVNISNSTLKCNTSNTNTDEGALVLRKNPPTADAKVTLNNVTFDTPNSNCDIVAYNITVSKANITDAPEGTEFIGTGTGSFTE